MTKQTRLIAVLGGGLAGLYTAYLLSQRGIPVRVFEARPRLGGRIHGLKIDEQSSLDLGPSWFWPHQDNMQRLCQQLGLKVIEQYTNGDALYQFATNQPVERFHGVGTMVSYRIAGGVSKLIQVLASALPTGTIQLSEAVQECNFSEDMWQIVTSETTLSASHLIAAVPPRVALASIEWKGALSPALRITLNRTPTWMATQAKFIAHYEQPFWRQNGLAGDAFSRVGPLVEVHDASADDDHGFALFGFLGVPSLQRTSLGQELLTQACLRQLVTLFGEPALSPLATALEDWSTQPYTCTENDQLQSPQHPECDLTPFASELKAHNLAFSSTEVASQDAGYLEGALVAARNAADFVAG